MIRPAYPAPDHSDIDAFNATSATLESRATLCYLVEPIVPCLPGGYKARETDKDMAIRTKALRGTLREWWRGARQGSCRLCHAANG